MTQDVYPREGVWGASGTPTLYDVEITPEHIRQGRIGVPGCCPVALAVADATVFGVPEGAPEHRRHPLRTAGVRVSGGLISWHQRDRREISVATPDRVLRWLHRFDNGERVAPMAFTLRCYSVTDTN